MEQNRKLLIVPSAMHLLVDGGGMDVDIDIESNAPAPSYCFMSVSCVELTSATHTTPISSEVNECNAWK